MTDYESEVICVVSDDGHFTMNGSLFTSWPSGRQVDVVFTRAYESSTTLPHNNSQSRIIGEHTLMLIGQTERLELVHRAQSRDVFAAGAVVAARFISTAAPGLYSMRDVLGLSGE